MKDGWTYKKLGDVTAKISDGSHNPPKGIDYSEYPMLSSKNVFFDCFNYDSPRYLSKEEFDLENKRTDISDGDILLTIVGTVGRTCCVKNPFIPFVLQRSVAVLKPKRSIIESRFLMYVLHSLSDFWNIEAKGVAQKGIYLKQLATVPIPVPSIAEQERIVAELDLLQGIIEKKKEQLKAYDQLAQSIFYTMFGDPIDNPKGWETKKLRDVCHHITDGDHMPPPKSDNGIPFLTISNVNKDKQELDFSNTFFVPQEYYDNLKDERKARINDMLYTVTGSYGIPVIVRTSRPFCFQRHIALLKPIQEKVLTSFLFYWALCPSIKEEADSVATGIAQKTVGLNSLRQFNVILPPLSLQQEFAEKVEAIERQKALVQQSIEETQTMFDYTMDKYFG